MGDDAGIPPMKVCSVGVVVGGGGGVAVWLVAA